LLPRGSLLAGGQAGSPEITQMIEGPQDAGGGYAVHFW
jgi:hypothetical protein